MKIFLWRLLTIIAFLSLGILLVASFADRISPLTNAYIAYIGLFFPFIFAFNIILFLFWIIFKKWKQIFFTIGVFILCWNSISAYFPIHTKMENIPDNCIKILTYNVMRFEYLKKHTIENPNPIVQYVVDQNPDIVCFQEFGASVDNKRELMLSDIKSALKNLPYCHIEKLKTPFNSQIFGLAIFSKYPILSTKKLPLSSDFNGSFIAELDINGRKTTLVNNHLESNKITADERTDYYNMTKELDTRKIEAFTHMMFQRLTPAFRIRAKQATIISEAIQDYKNPYVIVCGDFNDTPISYARHKIKGDLEDAFAESGLGMGITFNQHRFLFRIDYILHSKNIKAYNCTVGKLRNSDHYPVWTYLQLID